jgi:ABC-type transport system involved in multi-copper enzyme maturation permease subunit
MKRVSFSTSRVLLIAQNTVLEAARQKLLGFLLVLALGLVASARWFRDFNFGAPELRFVSDFGFGAMAFFGAVLAIAATAQLFFSEIENRTALTLLAKPVWRTEFILGKFFAVVGVVGVFCALLTVFLAVVLRWRESGLIAEFPEAFRNGRVLDFAALVVAGYLQWLKLGVLVALTLLVASFAQSQLYTVVMGFFVLVVCHLQYLAQEASVHSASSLARFFSGLIGLLFPNFQLFSLVDELGGGGVLPWARVARVTVYALGYVVAACALAVVSFRKREI